MEQMTSKLSAMLNQAEEDVEFTSELFGQGGGSGEVKSQFSNVAHLFEPATSSPFSQDEEFTSEPLDTSTPSFDNVAHLFEPSPVDKVQEGFSNASHDKEFTSELSTLPLVQDLWNQATDYVAAEFQRGWEQSMTGMIYYGKAPKEAEWDESREEWYKHIPAGVVSGSIDLGYYLGGFALGTAGSGGNPVVGTASSFALPGTIRKAYMDRLEKGEVKNASDFAFRVAGALKAGAEEGLVGAVMGGTGRVVGPVLKAPAELVAMTATSSLLHGKMPTLEDFASNAAIITGLHFTNPALAVQAGNKGLKHLNKVQGKRRLQKRVEENLKHLYKETGMHPEQVIKDMKEDPSIVLDLMTRKKKVPRSYQDMQKKEFSPNDITNLSTDINEGLLSGVDIWKYTRKVFDEVHRDGKNLHGFMKQAKYQIGKKVIDEVGTDDFQAIADFYVKKYLYPVNIEVGEKLIPKVGDGLTLGYTSPPEGVSDVTTKGVNEATGSAKIVINSLTSQYYGREGAVATLRHEIEHLLDYQKKYRGTASADWHRSKDPQVIASKTPADQMRTATDKTGGVKHHMVYDNFELDYLHRAMVRDALERGENVPEEVLYDYPDLQEYAKVTTKQKIVFEPGKDDRGPVDFKQMTKKAIDTFYEMAIDDLNPLKQMEVNLFGAKGAYNRSAVNSVYKAARLARGVAGKAKQYFELGGYDRKTGENNSKAFTEIIAQIKPEEHDAFVEWLVMQRAVELESQNIKSGFENIADKHKIVEEGRKKGFEDIFKDLQDYQNSLLRQLVDSGVLTEEAYDNMLSVHRHYVPYQRDVSKLSKSMGSRPSSMEVGKVVYQYKGSSAPVINPLYSIVENTFNILRAAENAEILQRLVLDIAPHDKEGRYVQLLESPLKLERDGKPKEGEGPENFVIRVKNSGGETV